jgi:putative holliday junction resolvase
LETKYLGIDYGARRVGIALSDINKIFSFSKGHLKNDSNLLSNLMGIIKQENIIKIIIGYPLNLKSQKTAQTLEVDKFIDAFKSNLTKNQLTTEIICEDERLSSRLAQDYINKSELKLKRKRDKGLVDEISASIILQSYLDKNKN